MNKLQWNIRWNLYIFVKENAFENVVCKMAATLLWPQCVNNVEVSKSYLPNDVWTALPCPYFYIVFRLKAFITYIHVCRNWWNSMNWWSGHIAVQQTVELPVIWDAMELMWPHYNGMKSIITYVNRFHATDSCNTFDKRYAFSSPIANDTTV